MRSISSLLLLMILLAGSNRGAAEAISDGRLEADLHLLRQFSRELAAMEADMVRLRQTVQQRERGYFTSDEHAAIESLLFRYLMCRQSLWEIVDAYRDEEIAPYLDTPDGAKRVILGVNAALKLAYYGSTLVATFLEAPEVVAKLNEAYHPYAIEAGTYSRIFRGVTDIDNLRDLRAAWELFRDDAGNPATRLYAVSISGGEYRELIRENYTFYAGVSHQQS